MRICAGAQHTEVKVVHVPCAQCAAAAGTPPSQPLASCARPPCACMTTAFTLYLTSAARMPRGMLCGEARKSVHASGMRRRRHSGLASVPRCSQPNATPALLARSFHLQHSYCERGMPLAMHKRAASCERGCRLL